MDGDRFWWRIKLMIAMSLRQFINYSLSNFGQPYQVKKKKISFSIAPNCTNDTNRRLFTYFKQYYTSLVQLAMESNLIFHFHLCPCFHNEHMVFFFTKFRLQRKVQFTTAKNWQIELSTWKRKRIVTTGAVLLVFTETQEKLLGERMLLWVSQSQWGMEGRRRGIVALE